MTPQERLAAALHGHGLVIESPDGHEALCIEPAARMVKDDPDLAADIELGQEWRLTEAALPEGTWLEVDTRYADSPPVAKEYQAFAVRDSLSNDERFAGGYGPTPAAALRALREALA